jgi:hypothetical protein
MRQKVTQMANKDTFEQPLIVVTRRFTRFSENATCVCQLTERGIGDILRNSDQR